MILRRRGCWFVAVAAGEEEEVRAESVLSQLLILCRQFELSRGRRVHGGLLFVPAELAETLARLLRDIAFPTEIYCLPGWVHFRMPQTLAYPLLWPAESVRAELAALQAKFDFPNEVQLVHRDGRECAFEYLGLPFAVYESDTGVWKFPLREHESGKGNSDLWQNVSTMGGSAKVIVREEFQRIRSMRRPHARFRSDSLYQLYAERWLESLIVRNPKYLDPELRSAPVYSQVPAYITRRRVIDLVAVTESGRLVVIEVKVQKSPDLLLQGLAYWRIVQQAQQQRAFQHNGYFRDVELSEEAPLLYCVTPLLALHAEQRHFAKWLRPEIPAYLIGINNDWRRGVKVLRKEKL
jgi:hypothetical protein